MIIGVSAYDADGSSREVSAYARDAGLTYPLALAPSKEAGCVPLCVCAACSWARLFMPSRT